MALFKGIYDWTLALAGHPKSRYWLAGISFAESTFFPVPPDVLLAPMCLAQRAKAWRYALICTLASVVGGVVGYLLGQFAFELIEPWLMQSHYAGAFSRAVQAFEKWGIWIVFLAGFSPIPYKVFTLSAGVVGMPFVPFLLASAVGRGGRFFLVAGLIRLGGERAAEKLRDWVDIIGWLLVLLIVIGLIVWKVLQ